MLKNLFLVLKGFLIGIGKIVPGVSGAVLAMTFGIYDKGIDCIVNFFKKPKSNLKFLFFVGLGVVLGIVLFSKIINYSIKYYYFITMLFFIGLISGGLPSLMKEIKIKNYYLIMVSFLLMTLLSLNNVNNIYLLKNNYIDYIIFLLGGIFEGIGTIVPGISGTALLMILGIYNIVIEMISSIIIDFRLIISFGVGMIVSIILISLLINIVLKKYKSNTYCFILGIILSTILVMFIKTFSVSFTILDFLIGLILFISGFIISNKL